MPETLTREESPNRLVNIRLLYEECGEFYDTLSPAEKHGAHKMMCFLYEKATGEPVPDGAHLTNFERKFHARFD